jgi:hypothetical protein
MKIIFVKLKIELTGIKEDCEKFGYEVYRTRLYCNCSKEFNRRDGLLIVNDTNTITGRVIKCKTCASTKGGPL